MHDLPMTGRLSAVTTEATQLLAGGRLLSSIVQCELCNGSARLQSWKQRLPLGAF